MFTGKGEEFKKKTKQNETPKKNHGKKKQNSESFLEKNMHW